MIFIKEIFIYLLKFWNNISIKNNMKKRSQIVAIWKTHKTLKIISQHKKNVINKDCLKLEKIWFKKTSHL